MKAICGKCKAELRLNVPEDYNQPTLKFKCAKCGSVNSVTLPRKEPKEQDNDKTEVLLSKPGWLVVHDENAKPQTYELKASKNTIGRLNNSKPCDIMIDTKDSYMSRNHFIIEVEPNAKGGFTYSISDPGSLNGTLINADRSKRLSPNDILYLVDGDVIQAGRTKIVLKTPKTSKSAGEAEKTVVKTDYTKTIII